MSVTVMFSPTPSHTVINRRWDDPKLLAALRDVFGLNDREQIQCLRVNDRGIEVCIESREGE